MFHKSWDNWGIWCQIWVPVNELRVFSVCGVLSSQGHRTPTANLSSDSWSLTGWGENELIVIRPVPAWSWYLSRETCQWSDVVLIQPETTRWQSDPGCSWEQKSCVWSVVSSEGCCCHNLLQAASRLLPDRSPRILPFVCLDINTMCKCTNGDNDAHFETLSPSRFLWQTWRSSVLCLLMSLFNVGKKKSF